MPAAQSIEHPTREAATQLSQMSMNRAAHAAKAELGFIRRVDHRVEERGGVRLAVGVERAVVERAVVVERVLEMAAVARGLVAVEVWEVADTGRGAVGRAVRAVVGLERAVAAVAMAAAVREAAAVRAATAER